MTPESRAAAYERMRLAKEQWLGACTEAEVKALPAWVTLPFGNASDKPSASLSFC